MSKRHSLRAKMCFFEAHESWKEKARKVKYKNDLFCLLIFSCCEIFRFENIFKKKSQCPASSNNNKKHEEEEKEEEEKKKK